MSPEVNIVFPETLLGFIRKYEPLVAEISPRVGTLENKIQELRTRVLANDTDIFAELPKADRKLIVSRWIKENDQLVKEYNALGGQLIDGELDWVELEKEVRPLIEKETREGVKDKSAVILNNLESLKVRLLDCFEGLEDLMGDISVRDPNKEVSEISDEPL